MALKIIGSGFGRTGTMTMKDALDALGFGPTHHMTEMMEHPEQLAHWKAIFSGESVDWHAVYAGYQSQVDWPGASCWEQAMAAFPDAKIIHTERPEEDWWASFNGTIGKFFATMDVLELPPHFGEIFTTMKAGFLNSTFTDFTDRESAIAAYRANNRLVREKVPEDRLLVFNVAEGWEPLCRFLGVAVPATPFPHHNVRREFWDHFGGEPEG
ncbi:MAG: sulfotransferase [Pseudomonadota bacterium]|nr:sulfotransferase [Pseudomonadota bacterium]